MKRDNDIPNCAVCGIKISDRSCRVEDGKHPLNCPTKLKGDLCGEVMQEYDKPEIREFARQASIQESSGYADRELGYEHVRPAKPRIEEILDFTSRMGYRKIGLAFCMGLRREAGIVEKEMPIHASNVMLVDPKTDERTRVRIEADKKDPDKRVRVAVKSGSVLD